MTKTKKTNNFSEKERSEFRGQMLEWYDQHRRSLPWRAAPGHKMEPYKVWLSEIMLQQTTVGAVIPYYTKFLEKWPNVEALAAAVQEEVMHEWAGLGYYARARNLHKCAQVVAAELNGVFPEDQKALQALPGIGEYTGAAIRAIAFNKPASVMDGNIERIMARYFAVEAPLPKSKSILKSLTSEVFEGFEERPGDLAQSLMDLGAGVCIAKTPRCMLCPIRERCAGYAQGVAQELPRKEKKKPKPKKYGRVYWITNERGQVLLHRRPQSGLLAGMVGLPTSEWEGTKSKDNYLDFSLKNNHNILNNNVNHIFTHFDLTLELISGVAEDSYAEPYFWMDHKEVSRQGFPTVFKKAVQIFLQS